ncbi:Gfo/Idh/MocA family protein [Lacrimispora amygdalina]|uniref:Gfo/Idh/MocA family protein n=1 Tax=Lacrimispora amygdalina TaxID=253257 RepID=UPI000BE41AA9|nr:Gfo/Idh/MocA family oxidoreductase [Lacrimispora amygdalina]
MVRVGVIGCGNIGRVHSLVLKELKEVRLCAMADIRIERAQEFCRQYTEGKGHAYESIEEMLEKEELDGVHICTPHYCHVPMAVMALEKGVHVFMEKPPAISRDQFEQLKEASINSSGRLGICFQNRYNETTGKVSELIEEGRIGAIRGGRAFVTWHRDASYYTESGWRGRLDTEGGGALMNQSIHALDLLLHWLGKPVRTEASMRNHHLSGIVEVEDTLEAYMEFTQGKEPVRASFYATTAYVNDAPVLIELAGERGFIRVEGDTVTCQEAGDTETFIWRSPKGRVPGKAYWGSGHEACIHDFYDCVNTGKVFRNDLESVRLTFDTMMDIYESAESEEK